MNYLMLFQNYNINIICNINTIVHIYIYFFRSVHFTLQTCLTIISTFNRCNSLYIPLIPPSIFLCSLVNADQHQHVFPLPFSFRSLFPWSFVPFIFFAVFPGFLYGVLCNYMYRHT